MYQTFSGTARRPRQVNLSGRPSNPFASANGSPGGAQQAIASAQQDRVHRQQQRERLQASCRIQKVWRGHSSRRKTFKIWRQIWDAQEETAKGTYSTAAESLRQLRRLVLFYNPREDATDLSRLAWYGTRQVATSERIPCLGPPWPVAYAKLQRACLNALKIRTRTDPESDRIILGILAFSARQAKFKANDATEYYESLTNIKDLPTEPLQNALLAPLSESKEAYTGLVVLLARPLNPDMLRLLRAAIDPRALSEAVAALGDQHVGSIRHRLWLLGNMICLAGDTNNLEFIFVIAGLLGSLADDVDFESPPIDLDNVSFDSNILAKISTGFPLNSFLHEGISSLIDQDSIRGLLVNGRAMDNSENARTLAGYALTLLRCFPRRGDEIRMWLHRGPSKQTGLPPTHYLWDQAKNTVLFNDIRSDSRGVLSLLKSTRPSAQRKDDWTVFLVFLELYMFDLKIMDDEEFMGTGRVDRRNNAVPITEVAELVTFLKNLGFTLYFNASDLNESGPLPARDTGSISISRRFGSSSISTPPIVEISKPLTIAGLPGLTVDYLKGLVTGILRAIYERDSRRLFLPKNHWLMTDRFDMTSFIPGVVAEEESRHVVQEQDEEDKDDSDDESESINESMYSTGRSYARILRSQEARARAQRKASRKRYLESVAPRLEILQNMPFMIPFHTRVQIFRQFVQLDQEKRRNGYVDPDLWRQSMMFQHPNGIPPRDLLARHHAQIKRKQEFQDAFESFYELGADLKEPIQITFVDEFDMPEAGIDGGGVTKEFLTSVTTQAFSQDAEHEHQFFVENEKHILFPNPNAIEDLRLRLQQRGFKKNSPQMREKIRELLKQYEFLGRIIGKCLYEGILVDVSFAGFFLKKWALTGGTGSASLESGYRANINDIRELDEDLYKGLLSLKNADDAESLSLSMAVNDVIGPEGRQTVLEHELVPGGADMAVTNENRYLYISRLTWYRLQGQSAQQTNAFLKGLSAIIQPSWLSMFNQSELQTLIGGAAAGIDVSDLRRNTLYGGTYVIGNDGLEHPSVELFWSVMQDLPDEDRRKVLKFVTSTPRGPLLGFSHLNPKFSIRDSGSDEKRFPTTSTCVNLLKLPMYKSAKSLREKLLAAVNSGAGFDLS